MGYLKLFAEIGSYCFLFVAGLEMVKVYTENKKNKK